MKIKFENAASLLDGIMLVAPDLGLELVESDAELTVKATEVEKASVSVKLDGDTAEISYGDGAARFFRGLAMLVKWVNDGETAKSVDEAPLFNVNGAMIDMSRNAVLNLETVKFTMRKMALMGMNTYMLYTEDTYEIEDYPYFGYMRGSYTKDELKELDAYAIKLGIELVPCVQMLGHLATHLRWGVAGAYKDTANALLVGSDETYKLIDAMLKTIAECFTSRRLHMGMDETHDLGTGKYLDINGYRERRDIYLEHLAKIVEMAKGYGFKPMMWSDMFFRLAGKNIPDYSDYDRRVEFTQEIIDLVPDGVQQIFWDYYRPNEDFYADILSKHDMLGENTMFAGGVWLWSGHCPQFDRSERNSIPALEACRKKGTKEVIATVWLNGSESSLVLSMAGLAWYADYDYKGGFNIDTVKECLDFSCGVSYDDFMTLMKPEYPAGNPVGASRALLYNDPLIGLVDKHIEGVDTISYYRKTTAEIKQAMVNKGVFTSAFEVIYDLSSLLENKADFGVRLKAAYDAKDNFALSALLGECDTIIGKIKKLRDDHRASWFEYNKPFGWEVHDIRYGGLISRFETVKVRLTDYLVGEIEHIEELEAKRLPFSGLPENAKNFGGFHWYGYTSLATASRL